MNTIDAIARTLTGAPDVEIPREVRSAINKALFANGRATLGGRKTVSEVRAYLREDEVAHAPVREEAPQEVIAYQGFAHAVPARKAEPTRTKVNCMGINLSPSSAHPNCARKVTIEAGVRQSKPLCHSHADQRGRAHPDLIAERAENIVRAEREREEYLARKEAYALLADINA